jgi:putative DNA primase/helicase
MERSPPSKIVPLKPPDAQAVKARLLQNLPGVLRHLLPAGTMRAGKFMVGNVAGDAGDSLVVELNGTKAGLWHDFATGAGGDVLDLWAVVRGFDRATSFPQLLNDIQEQQGLVDRAPLPAKSEQRANHRHLGKPTAKWDYTDAEGKIIASVYRYDPRPGQKEFRPWDAVRGVMRAPEIRPLYNQVGLKAADRWYWSKVRNAPPRWLILAYAPPRP